MVDAASKAVFHSLARLDIARRLASQYGIVKDGGFARRFIAGESLNEAIAVGRRIGAGGSRITLDYLGESAATISEAEAATQDYLNIISTIVPAEIERNLSLKLTQLGLDIDRSTCVVNLERILEAADRDGFFVRIDMESSNYTDATLDIVEQFWQRGYRGIGVVVQSCLFRTPDDLRRMNALGVRVRLVKGAYREPASVAHQRKSDVDKAFVQLIKVLLDEGNYPAIATHDPTMLDATRKYAQQRGIPSDRYEFQMLYGIRRDLQEQLPLEGYRLRVYLPFGTQWFPYFMRRLGERPANVFFVLRGIIGERAVRRVS